MLNQFSSATNQPSQDREQRRQLILEALRHEAEDTLTRLADELVDLPDDKIFGPLEYTLRDIAHEFISRAHQAGIDAGKKRGTSAPPTCAPPASRTPASSTTGLSTG
jgi:hypothetical protein